MQSVEQLKAYCDEVCDQIRWKKIAPILVAELEAHLYDQRDAYMAHGEEEAAATQKAIVQMGDAVEVGQALDRAHRPKPQPLLLVLTGILIFLGMAARAVMAIAFGSHIDFHILPYIIAFALLTGCYFLDFSWLGQRARGVYLFVLLCSLGGVLFGKTLFRGSGILYSVPLSYLSLIFPPVYSLLVSDMRKRGAVGMLLSMAAYVPFAVILLAIPTWGGLVIYTVTAAGTLCFAVCRGWFGERKGRLFAMLLAFVGLLGLPVVLQLSKPYALDAFLHPELYMDGRGYLYGLVRAVLSEAVFLGKGGMPQALGDITDLPNVGTDNTLVYFIHTYGFVVLLAVVLLLTIFTAVGLYKALKERSVLGSLTAFTIVQTIFLQAVFYIVNNLGYGLVSGLSLPFLSYGKTALFLNSALVGLMLSVFRTGEVFREMSVFSAKPHKKEKKPVFSFEDGALTIRFKN